MEDFMYCILKFFKISFTFKEFNVTVSFWQIFLFVLIATILFRVLHGLFD